MSRSFLTTKYAVIFHTSVQETNSLCAGSFVLSFLLPGVFKLQNNLCNLGQLLSINNRHLAVLPFNWPDVSILKLFLLILFRVSKTWARIDNPRCCSLRPASAVLGQSASISVILLLAASHWPPRLTWPEYWALIGWVRPGPNLYCPATTKLSKKSELMWKYKGNMSYNIRI